MKTAFVFLLLAVSAAKPQHLLPTAPIFEDIPGETVLAVFDDGTKFTMEQFRGLYLAMNPQMQQAAMKNRREWIQQFALFRKLAMMAEKTGLDKVTPTREMLEFNRLFLLSQAQLNANMNASTVESGEIVKSYEAGKDKYKQVKVKVIYISFISAALAANGQKGITEEQAKAKAEKLVTQIRKGADFIQLVKTNSDDSTSAEKNGDFGTLRATDNIPDAIRKSVFSLRQGEVTDPVRQPNGFYILKADEISYRPLSEVRDELYNELALKHHQEWLETQRKETTVKIVNEKFFDRPAETPPAAPTPAVK